MLFLTPTSVRELSTIAHEQCQPFRKSHMIAYPPLPIKHFHQVVRIEVKTLPYLYVLANFRRTFSPFGIMCGFIACQLAIRTLKDGRRKFHRVTNEKYADLSALRDSCKQELTASLCIVKFLRKNTISPPGIQL